MPINDYKNAYSKDDHYVMIIYDLEYFLESFNYLIYNEIMKHKYDISTSDELDDLVSESKIILIELYRRVKHLLDTKHKDKPNIEKTKILQSFVKKAFHGRLFNWWCKWKGIRRYEIKDKKTGDKKVVYDKVLYRYRPYYDYYGFSPEGPDMMKLALERYDVKAVRLIQGDDDGQYRYDFYIDDVMPAKLMLDRFWDFVNKILSEYHYKIFYMFYAEKKRYEEIMKEFNISRRRLLSLMWYIKDKLKRHYNNNREMWREFFE